ncbi:MAG: DNA mismatch repair endonuclease MutL [Saprospiraceae bacterium]|nr:DNA mismatch repair endonuclease MutL [Saprospiraceae bacterium]
MNDIIQLLPDNIANQIAAGEVIQRPSSVVKELLENAIDAGATEIKLILKDAGKSLIQVIDNGKGMSVTDARLSFERHATSKIKEANDLFHIKTMGFRGEALASIGSIAQVEMITRRSVDEVGNRLVMEGSKMTKQEPVQAAIGTSISVKNLFYNIPARRKFLKSDPVELKHVMDDFQRVALAYPEIFFSMYHNQHENFHLGKNNLRQRIISIVGKHVNEKLIPVQEQTDLVNISGFIVKPEGCKRTKGDQYLFVNRRFIKSNNLYHAIKTGYESLLQAEQYPGYFLNGLGQYSLAPMLDFNSDSNFNHAEKYILQNQLGSDEYHHPSLASHSAISSGSHRSPLKKETLKSWEDMYEALHQSDPKNDSSVTFMEDENQKGIEAEMSLFSNEKLSVKTPFQIHQSYVVTQIKSGLLIIDQQAAHERILYEHYKNLLSNGEFVSQKELFPRVVELDGSKASVLKEILPFVNALGFEISDFGNNSFIVHGTPSGLEERIPLESLLGKIIEQYLINYEFDFGIEDNLSRSMAWSSCIKKGKVLEIQEMIQIIDQLFACEIPYKSPSGKNCFITLELDEIQRRFNF